jgi:hypothetical protein
MLVATAAMVAPAHAALRVPQIAFNSATLAAQFLLQGETTLNVDTQQQDGLVWGSTVSTNSTMTIQFELTGNPHGNEVGIAKLDPTGKIVTGLAPVFPVSADVGSFAVASFRSGGILVVNLFDAGANLVSTTSTTGVNRQLFAYYIKNAGGTFFSHEGFNSDGKVHALAYAGSGENSGCWWLAFEDAPIASYGAAQFDDSLIFMESLNPTPVNHASWGKVKSLFR